MTTEPADKPLTREDITREVSKIKAILTEVVDDGVKQAMRGLKRGRYAAEDAIDDARHTLKQYPFEAIGIAFAAGAVAGALAIWALRPRSNSERPDSSEFGGI